MVLGEDGCSGRLYSSFIFIYYKIPCVAASADIFLAFTCWDDLSILSPLILGRSVHEINPVLLAPQCKQTPVCSVSLMGHSSPLRCLVLGKMSLNT